MKKLIPLMSLAVLAACGEHPKHRAPQIPQVDKIVQTVYSLTKPVIMTKQVATCEKNFSDVFDLTLNLLINGSMIQRPQNFLGLITETYLMDTDESVVNYSIYGVEVENRGETTKVNNQGIPLNVCPEVPLYARNTYESAGLNASYVINKTSRKVKAAMPEIELEPIGLFVGPQIKTVVPVKREGKIEEIILYQVDNAFYQPSMKAIILLPHSENMKKRLIPNFWEVPMVASHEYGHHIFSTLTPDLLGDDSHVGKCFHFDQPAPTVEKRTMTVKAVNAAFNEGFADLISFYTLSSEERGLKGVVGLEVDRQVDSPIFRTGNAKSFSANVLTDIFLEEEKKTPDNVQEIHAIGAIFAHNADKLMTSMGLSNDEKLKTILSWAQGLNTQYDSLKKLAPKTYMEEIFKLLLSIASEQKKVALTSEMCGEIEKSYAGLSSTLTECAPVAPQSVLVAL